MNLDLVGQLMPARVIDQQLKQQLGQQRQKRGANITKRSAIQRRLTKPAWGLVTAFVLVACGGGGGGNATGAGSNQSADPVTGDAPATPQPTPGPAPVAPVAGLEITADTTAQRNTRYDVAATTGIVNLTLPQFIVAGDFVSIRGLAGSRWRLTPNPSPGTTARSDMTPQAVFTDKLPGNVAPGRVWKGQAIPITPQAISSNQSGEILIAASSLELQVSTDAGATWAAANSPAGQNWVSVAARTEPYPSASPGRSTLLAAAAGGLIYSSLDLGRSWLPLTSTDPGVNLANRDWRAVTTDQRGINIAAAVFNGPIYRNAQSGREAGWQAGTLVGTTTPLIRPWRGIASEADGNVMAAVTEAGEVFVSETGGQTWQLRNVTVVGTAIAPQRGQWSQVAISANGNTIAVAGERSSSLFISRDRGVTWSQATAPPGDYTAIAMSADASVIGASLSDTSNAEFGSLQISRDGGASFDRAQARPEGISNWRTLAISADGNQYVASSGGRVFTSLGNRTSIGARGAIEGGANDFVEVEFLGQARFKVRQFIGGPFTVR